jgi:hypothetical protein
MTRKKPVAAIFPPFDQAPFRMPPFFSAGMEKSGVSFGRILQG